MAEQTGLYVTSKFASAIQNQPDVSHNGGRVRSVSDRMASTDAANGDTIHLARLPSNAVLHANSKMWHGDFGTGITFDIGTFNLNTGADDDDSIASAVDVATAAAGVELMSTATAIANHGKRLWEIAGQSQDPGGEIDIKVTIGGGDPGAAALAWEILYTID